jgi:ribosomal protein S18 acetylase RimI-like enzyme
MNIKYTCELNNLTPDNLMGFFKGWANHPDCETHFKILSNSYVVWLAFDKNKCVGFINALSDGIFYSFIPLLEVFPEYQGNGIGSELVSLMNVSLDEIYAIDVICDESVASFYEQKSFKKSVAMIKRNYNNQSGKYQKKLN